MIEDKQFLTCLLTCQVLSAGDDAVGLEQLDEDADDIALHKARRIAGSMSAMSGAQGMVYMEYRYDPWQKQLFKASSQIFFSFQLLYAVQCIISHDL